MTTVIIEGHDTVHYRGRVARLDADRGWVTDASNQWCEGTVSFSKITDFAGWVDEQFFVQWMEKVDERLYTDFGVVSDDLPDFNYRDAFDANHEVRATAHAAYKAAGGY